MKRILAITTIRSDYDLMSGLYRLLHQDPGIDFRLLVGRAHLSPSFGLSVELIYRDGFKILGEIESLISADSPSSRLKTASIFLQSAVDLVSNWNPELIMFAGDREDVLVGGMLGAYLRIPTVHFFGGDHGCDGHVDNLVRNAASKLATAHVVSIEEHRQRLISIGELPTRIFVAGSIALDKFVRTKPMSKQDLFARMPQGKRMDGFALLIYHVMDGEEQSAGAQFEDILLALKDQGIAVAGNSPNTDAGHSRIVEVMRRHEADPSCWFFKNLEREWFLLPPSRTSSRMSAPNSSAAAATTACKAERSRCFDSSVISDSEYSSRADSTMELPTWLARSSSFGMNLPDELTMGEVIRRALCSVAGRP